MRHRLLSSLFLAVFAQVVAAEQWQIDRHETCGYNIRFPDSYVAIIVAPARACSGTTIRIAQKDIARFHGLDIALHPGLSLHALVAKLGWPS